MSSYEKYLELRKAIIEPTLQELKQEYEQRGYRCEITDAKLIKDIGTKTVRSFPGQVSFIQQLISSNIKKTVTIYFNDGGGVSLTRHKTIASQIIALDDLTPEALVKAIKFCLGEKSQDND